MNVKPEAGNTTPWLYQGIVGPDIPYKAGAPTRADSLLHTCLEFKMTGPF